MSNGRGLPRAEGLRVVVAGGGFAGLYAASYLARSELALEGAETVLVDAKNHFTFTPLLAEVVAGSLGREHVTYSYRVLGHRSGFRFVQNRVVGLDPDARLLLTDREPISFDYLVFALGTTPRYFGVEGAQEHSLPITSVDDALAIRDRVVASHEAAVLTTDPEDRRRILTFVVAGAGPAGVEVASEIGHLANQVLPRYYPGLPSVRVVVVQSADRILQGWDDALADSGLEALRRSGLEVHLNTLITQVSEQFVEGVGPDGPVRWPLGTLVWTAGAAPPSWIDALPLATDQGAIRVNSFLQVEGSARIYAAGDGVALVDSRTGRPYPKVAPIAISQGVRAAANIESHALGLQPEPYQAHHAGSIVSLGAGVAFAEILGVRVTGRVAWWLYRSAYLFKLVGLKNKIRLVITLVLNLFFERDISSTHSLRGKGERARG